MSDIRVCIVKVSDQVIISGGISLTITESGWDCVYQGTYRERESSRSAK